MRTWFDRMLLSHHPSWCVLAHRLDRRHLQRRTHYLIHRRPILDHLPHVIRLVLHLLRVCAASQDLRQRPRSFTRRGRLYTRVLVRDHLVPMLFVRTVLSVLLESRATHRYDEAIQQCIITSRWSRWSSHQSHTSRESTSSMAHLIAYGTG